MEERGGGAAHRWNGPLLGRDEILGELVAAADAAGQGAGSLVLLSGEAGIGKTSLVRALTDAVHGEFTVSWGRCIADGSAPAFWPWRDVVATDVAEAADGRALLEGAIGARRYERLNDLRSQLIDRAHQEPLLHVIEDLQWADVASILLLVHAGGAIGGAPAMVVGTLRTGELLTPQQAEAIEEVHRVARVHALPPLGDDEIAELIRANGLPPADALTTLVRQRTGGNPLFVSELLRAVREADSMRRSIESVAAVVPVRIIELIGHRLGRLPAMVAEAVVTAAVLGFEGDATTVARIQGTDVAAILDLLEQARAARLLDLTPRGHWQFRHALARDAVYGSVPEVDRARLHHGVLDALAADPLTPAATLASHALAALPLVDPDRAVALAARAGEDAFARHGYEEAVAWSERALDVAPRDTLPRWRAELLVRCGEAHRHIGALDQARSAFQAAAELTDDPGLLARAALGFADPGADLGIAYRSDDPATAELLTRAITAQPVGDSLTTVFLEARLAAELYFSETPGRARDLGLSALHRAQRLGDPWALGVAGAVVHDGFVVGQRSMDDLLAGSEQLVQWAGRPDLRRRSSRPTARACSIGWPLAI